MRVPEKKPLVSIGMPLYNEERYLCQTLDSLISQDYDNFELIISDNASFDSTPQICQEYAAKDARLRYHRNETNIGASANFKRVFQLSEGDYFVWVAGHDLWHSTFLSCCLETLLQDDSVVLCHPQALWIDTDGQPLGLIPSSVETRGLNQISRFHVVLWGLGYCYPIYGVISSKALRQANLGVEVIAPDAILLAELSLLGAFAHISQPLLYMRQMDDYGSWDKYVEKIFRQSLSSLSVPSMYWQMIDEHLKVVSKHINSSLEKDAATLSTVLCLLTKYSWVLNGLQNSIQQLSSSDSLEERLKQIGSQLYESTRAIEILFNKSDRSNDSEKRIPKIIIDGVFFQLFKTGIARVWKSLLEEWIKTDFGQHIIILDRGSTAPKIPGYQYRLIPPYYSDSSDASAQREMLEQICLEEGAYLFISTYYTTPVSTPSVFMAYDMVPEVMAWDMNRPLWQDKHHAIRNASSYLAISENTANDLVRFFPEISRDSVKVAYCGVDRIFYLANPQEIDDFKDTYKIGKPYFLLVGLRGGYKNAMLFFQSFAKLENKDNFAIVCVGGGEELEEEFATYVQEINIYLLPHIDDNELRLAYSGAIALVYPSKYEGFGLPILEAIACGCPVITCPLASIPEVAGDAVIYVNDDVDQMTDALRDIQNLDVRESLISAGFEQASKFSWSKMAEIVSSVLIEATLLHLKLRETNLIVFPDWCQSEEAIGRALEKVIMTILTHPESHKITLLIDTSNLEDNSEIDANLVVSGVVMNLLMQEDLEMAGEPEISLVGKLSELQWQTLLPHIQARISLENENKQVSADTKIETIPLFQYNKELELKTIKNQMNLSSEFVERYHEYLQNNYPGLDSDSLSRIDLILESTSWDDPKSAIDLNNFAVIALIEAEQTDDSVRELYIDMALEALNRGLKQYDHPLCAAHLAIFLTMIGERQQAIEIIFPMFINMVQYVYSDLENTPPGIIYLPRTSSSFKTNKNDELICIVQANDGYNQSILLLSETLCRVQLVFYNAMGLRFLNLAAQVLPDSISINFKLGISSLMNDQWEGLLYLHRAIKMAPDYAPILQVIYLAYKNLEQIEIANYWLEVARKLERQSPNSIEWRWTELELDSPFTYIPFESDLLLAVEPSFRSFVTGVLIAEGDWFEKEMEFWRSWIKPGMIVIDVGANVGVYTFSAARRVGPKGRVLAVEPFSGCVHCLQETCKINQLDWVKVCVGAASDREGKARLSLSTASELNEVISGDAAEKMKPGSFEEVSCFSLDILIKEENLSQVDFIKIDAEGHELSVLAGSDRILSEFAPIILYENIAGSKGSNLPVAEYLKSRGYQLFRYQAYIQKLIPLNSDEDLLGNLNIIALPPNQISRVS